MHSRSNNKKFMSYGNANEVVNEHFESLLSNYQTFLEISMRGSDFISNSVQLLYNKCHKIDSPDRTKKKKTTINPNNADDKCFQYAVTFALNYEEIESYPERASNIKPFINKFNWKGINYPSKIDDWKTFEKNNLTIALHVLHMKEKEIYPGYIKKHNSTRHQIILLMIPNEEKERRWYYLAVKKISALLHRITSKNNVDFYCLSCLPSFRTENKLKSHEKVL